MKKKFREILKNTFLFDIVWYWRKKDQYLNAKKEIKEWKRVGCPNPAPTAYKIKNINEYRKKYAPQIFIETGTFWGNMVWHMKNKFKQIYSIELSEKLYQYNKKFFSKYKNIDILHGDSGKILPDLLANINEPCLFWLDAHYSGEGNSSVKGDLETPIIKELEAILNHNIKNHIILIDDAREFIGKNDYPTIKFIESFIKEKNPDLKLETKYDIIHITPSINK